MTGTHDHSGFLTADVQADKRVQNELEDFLSADVAEKKRTVFVCESPRVSAVKERKEDV